MKKYFLELVVFICGAVVMMFEIVGSRVLGPFLGTSIFIWTSLIGIILGSLSLGYFLGGRIADKKPSYNKLAWIILAAAIFIGMTTWDKDFFLVRLPRYVPGLKWQSVISALVLFAPASVFLGMVSPYTVKLKLKNLQTTGSTVGNLYAISTIGSIVGTFMAGFVLIPAFGSTNILYFNAALLVLLSIVMFLMFGKKQNVIIPLAFLVSLGYSNIRFITSDPGYIDVDTQYNRVLIYEDTDYKTQQRMKLMRINNERSSAIYTDNEELVFMYLKYYQLAAHFNPGFSSTLCIGGAGYTYPMFYLKKFPEATIDVVEIDPELTQLAREHFRLKDDPRMNIIHEDGRTYINRTNKKYDVFLGDAYKSIYAIPWHLTTVEAAQKTYDLLNDEGVVIINIISAFSGKGSQFLRAETATYKSVFPQVYIFAAHDTVDGNRIQSIVLVALKSKQKPSFQSEVGEYDEYLGHEITDKIILDMPVLTDEYAPVEYYANKAF